MKSESTHVGRSGATFGLRREAQRHAAFGTLRRTRKTVSPLRSATALQSFATLLLCVFALIPAALFAATNDLTNALQKGLFEEEANHNLEAAAQAYQTVSAQFDKDRKLAATAIFRLGEVYRKQGRTNEASAQYERIVREFSDQQTLVTLSRQNLGGIGRDAPASAFTTEHDENPGRKAVLKNEIASLTAELERLKGMNSLDLRIAVQQNYPNPVLTELVKQLVASEQTLARLQQDWASEHPEVVRATTHVETVRKQIAEQVSGTIKGLEFKLDTAKAVLAHLEKSSPVAAVRPASDDTSQAATDDEEKEIRRIQAMIQNSPDLINAPATEGLTPLGSAARFGQLRVAGFLLDAGAKIDLPSNGLSPLHIAASEGHKTMVRLLLARGADVNVRDDTGGTALHRAAQKGFLSVAEVLIRHKADLNARTSEKNLELTPLHAAAKAGHPAVAAFLVSKGADLEVQEHNGMTALSLAASARQTEVVSQLLALGAKPDVPDRSGRTPLSYAAERNLLDAVRALLTAQASPNASTNYLPLLGAVYAKNFEMAELLLRAGANPNRAAHISNELRAPNSPSFIGASGPFLPLQIAVAHRDAEMARLLLKFKADANAKTTWDPRRPISSWALTDPEMLKALLEGGADANAEAWEGQPLLAAASGNSVAVELLLARGAKANIQNRQSRTPLDLAAQQNCLKCVELLLAANADPNLPSQEGSTALHVAVNHGSLEMVETLLAASADVNRKTDKGETPLHWAVRLQDQTIARARVELLLSKGADPNVRNNEGLTPLDLVKQPNPAGFGVGAPQFQPLPPAPGTQLGATVPSIGDSKPVGLAAVLLQHGARDDLPKLDRIEVRRTSANYSAIAFQAGTNGWNEFSLLESLALHYGFITTDQNAVWEVNKSTESSQFWRKAACQFPDLSRITIRRPAADEPRWTQVAVNAAALLESVDCSRDVKLQPGDIVEIPEADHPVNEPWSGLAGQQLSNLLHCVSRSITVSIKGVPTQVQLSPEWKPRFSEPQRLLTKGSFMLKSVLAQSRLLRASSDLSRVKVTRRAGAGGKAQEWVLNCGSGSDPDLWLRDGDVIEVPDKP